MQENPPWWEGPDIAVRRRREAEKVQKERKEATKIGNMQGAAKREGGRGLRERLRTMEVRTRKMQHGQVQGRVRQERGKSASATG